MAGEGRIKGWLQPQRAVGVSNILTLLPAVVSALCGCGQGCSFGLVAEACVLFSLVLWDCGSEEQGSWGSD